jgi:hypothetical protein
MSKNSAYASVNIFKIIFFRSHLTWGSYGAILTMDDARKIANLKQSSLEETREEEEEETRWKIKILALELSKFVNSVSRRSRSKICKKSKNRSSVVAYFTNL